MSKKDPFAPPSRIYPKKTVEVAETPDEVEDTIEVPAGTITEIRVWAGDDVERITAALEAEEASDHPRVTLIEYLKDLIEE